MPDNQPLPSPLNLREFFALDGWSVLALEGPDAAVFAHAQFASDVRALATGHWQWSTWLNPKGRVIALFALLRTGDGSLRMLLPDANATLVGDALRRFVFRRKVVLVPRADLHVAGAFGAAQPAPGVLEGAEDAPDGLRLGIAPGRVLRIGTSPAPAYAEAVAAWDVADLRAGIPRLPASQAEQWTPQQLGLERLRAFSVSKGCYPGQEIVARTHFLGKAKRQLVLLRAGDAAEAGAEVAQDGRAIGNVVAAAGQAPRLALAVLPLELADAPLAAAGAPATVEPFAEVAAP